MVYKVKNWTEFQHYRDRNPPWIKLHFSLLASEDWVTLDDASRVLAVACMLIASRNNGEVPNNPDYMRRVAYLNSTPNFKPLIDCGFLECASNMLADASAMLADASNLQANARPETETETETETEGEAEEKRDRVRGTPPGLQANPAPTDSGGSRKNEKTAKRLPEDFELTKERRAVAEAERLPADRTFAKFVDYWRSASGARARKLDWDATWRNWCRTEADRARSTPAGAAGPPPKGPPATDEQVAQARREAAEKNRREMERLNRPQLEAAEKRDVAGLIRATAAKVNVTGGR